MAIAKMEDKVRAALIRLMGSKTFLRPTTLIDSLVMETSESKITIQQSLARLFREKWIVGVTAHGEAIAPVKIIGHVPPPPPNPELDRWRSTLEQAGLEDQDIAALNPMYKQLACFDALTQKQILDGLLRLRGNLDQEVGRHRFIVSARYLIGSSKLLDTFPATALKAFGIQIDRFPSHPLYVVVAGCAQPETVILVENPAAFEMAVATRAAERCAFIATFGFGLSKSEEDYGNQLAEMVKDRFSGAITLMREGSSCPPAKELLNHENITFWGDLDVAGIEIFKRMKRSIPNLRLSALYKPMLDVIDRPAGSHPYVSATGKQGQKSRYPSVRCEDSLIEEILSKCSERGVDQECVLPEQVEQFAIYAIDSDAS